jgi:polysaccharide export outer membrane protein
MFKRLLAGCFASFVLFTGFAAASAPASPPPAAVVEAEEPLFEYHLGAGDKLRVIVFGEDTLSGEFVVSSAGTVELPLIGAVSASGLTIAQFQAAVEKALRDGYLKDPRVSAEVENYRPFFILGEVQKPGQYPYTASLTVMNAVATAQGFTYRADTRHVFIKHLNDPGEHKVLLTTTTPVEPGDTIRIPERFF